jgi:glycosyltransferase involved in cell wall biosynthesis
MSGGVERVMLNLAGAMAARGHRIDLVVGELHGPFVAQIPAAVRVIDLNTRSVLQALPALPRLGSEAWPATRMLMLPHAHSILGAVPKLARYLAAERPTALLAGIEWPNITALLARRLAGCETRIVIGVHDMLSARVATASFWQRVSVVPPLVRHYYPQADAIVAVSNGVAADTATMAALAPERITTIYNPVTTPAMGALAAETAAHPWFNDGGAPVILAAGRLKPEKDFVTLIDAFALLRKRRAARLVILGDGWQRPFLTAHVRRLGLGEVVDMPGFLANPFACMARARLFVLSSRHEGFANVVAEALHSGCPVVSTNCPSGPGEILDGGLYGTLTAVGDATALATAIDAVWDVTPDRERLRARALDFSVERATARYLDVMLGSTPG